MAKQKETAVKKVSSRTTKLQEETQGFILLACGHPYYGMYAWQLAMSIIDNSEMKVSLIYDDEGIRHLSEEKRLLFDKLIKLEEKHTLLHGKKSYVMPKVYLYDLSPYDKTIFLDADMIVLPKKPLRNLFTMLNGKGITMQNRGCVDISKIKKGQHITWATTEAIIEAYKLTTGKLYNLASEFIYFEKGDNSKQVFHNAKEIYKSPGLKFLQFSGTVPDELAFSISMIHNKTYPHADNFMPIYWESMEKRFLKGAELHNEYYGYSLGGAVLPKIIKRTYDNYVKYYASKFGATGTLIAKDKRSFMTVRTTI